MGGDQPSGLGVFSHHCPVATVQPHYRNLQHHPLASRWDLDINYDPSLLHSHVLVVWNCLRCSVSASTGRLASMLSEPFVARILSTLDDILFVYASFISIHCHWLLCLCLLFWRVPSVSDSNLNVCTVRDIVINHTKQQTCLHLWICFAAVFAALSPHYCFKFLIANKRQGWVMLGGVLLSVTGAEAMFADLGHFTRPSIRSTIKQHHFHRLLHHPHLIPLHSFQHLHHLMWLGA